jgi:hypothetical protein
VVRMTNGNAHMFHQTVFAAAYLVDTGGRDLSRADTAFDDGTLQVAWDESDIDAFHAITEPPAAPTAPRRANARLHGVGAKLTRCCNSTVLLHVECVVGCEFYGTTPRGVCRGV